MGVSPSNRSTAPSGHRASTYGLTAATRDGVVAELGTRPVECCWPRMLGKRGEQKRMEHVWRLLSFCAKRVMDSDDDGIVLLVKCSNEAVLEERVLTELEKIVGTGRLHEFEGEVASELRKRVAGYKRADSIRDWLTNIHFEHHVYWHLASSQQTDPAFSVIVHYHRFGRDALRKLHGSYVRGCLERSNANSARRGKTTEPMMPSTSSRRSRKCAPSTRSSRQQDVPSVNAAA